MMKLLPLVSLVLLSGFGYAQGEPVLRSGDHKKLAKPLGKWMEAKAGQETEDQLKARDDLNKALESVQKSARGKEVLSLVGDWSEALRQARGTMVPRARTGKLQVRDTPAGKMALWVPKKYNPKKSAVPLLVLLPGPAEDPEAVVEALPSAVTGVFAVACPDLRDLDGDQMMEGAGRGRILGAGLGIPNQELLLDWNRIYLAGFGDSGAVAAQYGCLMPYYFAGVAIINGSTPEGLPSSNRELCGLTELAAAADLETWLGKETLRNPYPTEFKMEFTKAWAPRAYWIVAESFEAADSNGKPASLTVKVDRASNTINLTGEKVYKVNLFLNDAIVDLSKPINIVRNNKPYQYEAARSVGRILESFWAMGLDWGQVYPSAVYQLELPTPEDGE
ncbi:MAG: hypothetical protein DWQ01_13250 [Planctomycetota bacterium]|nr:MAG: hypothetical protein DWQ01_13250 [Planctomycetota bacterium]